MITSALSCSNDIVTLIIGTHRIHCVILKEISSNEHIVHYQELIASYELTLAQPTVLEDTIRSFLMIQKIPNAFVALALSQDTIRAHELLQCQLLAINTPFHCAGITTTELAREYAKAHGAQIPKNTYGIPHEDLLSCVGLYIMARKSS